MRDDFVFYPGEGMGFVYNAVRILSFSEVKDIIFLCDE